MVAARRRLRAACARAREHFTPAPCRRLSAACRQNWRDLHGSQGTRARRYVVQPLNAVTARTSCDDPRILSRDRQTTGDAVMRGTVMFAVLTVGLVAGS